MSKEEAVRRAKEIPLPQPGEILSSVPVEVFLAFMELHNLKPKYWSSEFVVLVRKSPEKESQS